MVDHFLEKGHEVLVVTSADHGETSDRKERIMRMKFSTPDKRVQKNKTPSRDFPFRGWLKKLYDMFIWPDESSWWAHGVILDSKKIVEEFQPEVLITVSWPFSTHLIGRSLKKQQGTPWLMDVGDPFHHGNWPPRNNEWFYKRRNEETEIELLNLCDAVCVTNANLASVYNEYLVGKTCEVLGPIGSSIIKRSSPTAENDSIRIGYFGSFYDGVRDPEGLGLLCSILRKMDREAEIHFYGNFKKHVRQKIMSLASKYSVAVQFAEAIGRDEVMAVMSGFDILLSIGNASVMQTPSKVVDYALAARPVIHLPKVHSDPVVEFFHGHGAFIELPDDPDKATEVRSFIEDARKTSANDQFVDRIRMEYSSQAVAEEYLNILEIIRTPKSGS